MSDLVITTNVPTTTISTVNNVTNIDVTQQVVQVAVQTSGLQGIPGAKGDSYTPGDPIYVTVTNKTGSTLNIGDIVYTSGANGVHTQVSKAIATSDATSARTLGWVAETIANNADGLVMVEGYLDGVNTQGVTEGAQLYLSGTVAGGFQETKPQAPIHLVYVGVCSKASAGNGRVYVKVQNGYEIDELHDVQIISKQNNDVLRYDSTSNLWKNVASTALTVGSAITAGTAVYASSANTALTAGTASYSTSSASAIVAGSAINFAGSITRSQVSDFTSGTVASASTAQQAGTAAYSLTSGSAYSSTFLTGSITKSQVSDFASGTVASASTAQQAGTAFVSTFSGTATYAGTASQAGTAVYGTTAGSAFYATYAGTATVLGGSITSSQVSDLSTTLSTAIVANISGTVTQSQVTNLTTDLAGKASLGSANTFTVGGQIITNAATAVVPITVRGISGQSANLQEWQNSTPTIVGAINNVGGFWTTNRIAIGFSSVQTGTKFISQPGVATDVGVIVRGAASQSANLLEIQDSSASTVTSVTSAGIFSAAAVRLNNAGLNSFGGAAVANQILTVNANSTAYVPLVVKGASGQSANLQEWQNSGGTALAYMQSGGNLKASNVATLNSLAQLAQANSGGVFIMARQTAAYSNPGANSAALYFRDGTNAGTLKLVVRAGAAGAETTILDNIPQ